MNNRFTEARDADGSEFFIEDSTGRAFRADRSRVPELDTVPFYREPIPSQSVNVDNGRLAMLGVLTLLVALVVILYWLGGQHSKRLMRIEHALNLCTEEEHDHAK